MAYIYDFSQWQGTVDFAKVKADAELLILRVQSGSTHPDTNYKTYIAGAKANKIPFGTYAYAKFISVADALQEAKDCFARTDKESQFIVVDVEEVDCALSQLAPATQAYIDYLHSQGVKKVGLYSGESFYKAHLTGIKADFLWIANYGINDGLPHTKPSVTCDLWQYSDKARTAGVVTQVDVDQLVGSKPLSYFTGSLPAPVVATKPAPAPAPSPVAPKAPVVAPKPSVNLPTGIYRIGVKGAGVKIVQESLNQLHFNCGKPDGSYGPSTADAVKRFQIMFVVGSKHDGIYDSATRTAMLKELNK